MEDNKELQPPAQGEENLARLYEENVRILTEGEIVSGRVVRLGKDEVHVDVGLKSEGRIPFREFLESGEKIDLQVGKEIEVYIEKKEGEEGEVLLSWIKAVQLRSWEKVRQVYQNQTVIEGTATRLIKGGVIVKLGGVEGFLPASQSGVRYSELTDILGDILRLKIIEVNPREGRVVVSQRVVLEEERQRLRMSTLESLKEGEIRRGVVKKIVPFGAFIDLGGIDGLLHVSDISWGRVNPYEILRVGEEVEVKVLSVNKEKEKISLGIKQKTLDPWSNIEEKFPLQSVVTGRVVNITDFGAFVELEEGVEGLIHVSEMSWTRRVKHPSQIVSVGDTVKAVVLEIKKSQHKMFMGLRQIQPNPWLALEKKYPVGSRITGVVKRITDFGAFVEVKEGIQGLIHVSDLSWSTRFKRPLDFLHKGQRVRAAVLGIDPKAQKLSLGLKQLTPDPWMNVPRKYPPGKVVKGKVTSLAPFGVFVELEEGVEGLTHISQLSEEKIEKPENVVKVGDEITAKVIKIYPRERKISLSVKKYLEDTEREQISQYLDRGEGSKILLGEILVAALQKRGESWKEVLSQNQPISPESSGDSPSGSTSGKGSS